MSVGRRRAAQGGAGAARRRSDSVGAGQGGGRRRRTRAGSTQTPGRGPQTGGAVRGVDAAEPCRRAAGQIPGVVARRQPSVRRGVVGLVLLARAVAAAAHARQGGRAPPRAAPAAERWWRGRVVSLSGLLNSDIITLTRRGRLALLLLVGVRVSVEPENAIARCVLRVLHAYRGVMGDRRAEIVDPEGSEELAIGGFKGNSMWVAVFARN